MQPHTTHCLVCCFSHNRPAVVLHTVRDDTASMEAALAKALKVIVMNVTNNMGIKSTMGTGKDLQKNENEFEGGRSARECCWACSPILTTSIGLTTATTSHACADGRVRLFRRSGMREPRVEGGPRRRPYCDGTRGLRLQRAGSGWCQGTRRAGGRAGLGHANKLHWCRRVEHIQIKFKLRQSAATRHQLWDFPPE
jgi:hypothetical protein